MIIYSGAASLVRQTRVEVNAFAFYSAPFRSRCVGFEVCEKCCASVGIIAFMSLNSRIRQRVRTLFIYSYVVYPLFSGFVFWMCDSYVLRC